MLAYLPALLYLGHLDIRVDIPGVGDAIPLPLVSSGGSAHAHTGTDDRSHEDHCHGDGGACGDSAQLTVAPVAALREQLLVASSDGTGRAVAIGGWRPAPSWTVAPPSPPPRAAA
jgi:hypothetical protein